MENTTANHPRIRVHSGHTWIITSSIVFLSVFGIILALICIYSLPDGSVQPLFGGLFYCASALAIVVLVFMIWRKDRAISLQNTPISGHSEVIIAPVQEGVSDKILKWIAGVFTLFFVFDSIAIALICIYALPDKTVQPVAGSLYILGGAFVAGSFLYILWKRTD